MTRYDISRLTACKNIIRNAKKAQHSRTAIHGRWYADGLTVVSDGFRAVRTTIDSSSLPDAAGIASVITVLDHTKTHAKIPVLRVPDEAAIKTYIADAKERGDMDRYGNVRYFLKADNGVEICVNAKYLLDMVKALPGSNVLTAGSENSALYFSSLDGDGVLLPCMFKKPR